MKPRGRFLVLDGPDGCGKSTQAARLAKKLAESGREVVHLREPGSTAFGEALRGVLLARDVPRGAAAEALTFFAARAQLLEEQIAPALDREAIVVCERFASSTYAYQGVAGGAGAEFVRDLERLVVKRAPDRILLLDLDPAVAHGRIDRARDGIEERSEEFHRRVRAAFLEFARGRADAVVIDARGSEDEVAARVLAEAERALL